MSRGQCLGRSQRRPHHLAWAEVHRVLAPSVKGIESALPDAVVGLILDARRRTESRQHLPAATVFRVLAKGTEDASRRWVLQTLEDQTQGGRWFGFDEQMKARVARTSAFEVRSLSGLVWSSHLSCWILAPCRGCVALFHPIDSSSSPCGCSNGRHREKRRTADLKGRGPRYLLARGEGDSGHEVSAEPLA